MMTMKRRTEVLEALELTRARRVCAYMGTTCDCKYGIVEFSKTFPKAFINGEQNGCPEMREAIAIIRFMTDDEWAKIERRMLRQAKATYKKLVLTPPTPVEPRSE